MTLALFHTAESNKALFESLLTEMAPDIRATHLVRAELLAQAVESGTVTPAIHSAVRDHIQSALDDGAAIVLCTCSTLGVCIDALQDSRVLRVDRPMAERAIATGGRVLVAVTIPSTIEPTLALLRQVSPDADLEPRVIEEAWPHVQAGRREEYWKTIADSIRQRVATGTFGCVVLAQALMAGAANYLGDLAIPVFSSPRIGLEPAIAAYRKLAKNT